MSGKKKGTKASTRNPDRRNGKAWGKNHGNSGGPKPKSPEKAARRRLVKLRQHTPVAERATNEPE